MKAFLVCTVLMGVLVTPAMADLVPMPPGSAVGVNIPPADSVGPRSVPYCGCYEIYDNMPSQVGGPSNVAFAWGVGAGNFLLDDIHSMAGTRLSHAHMLVQGFTATGQLHSHLLAYYSNNSANNHVGTLLLTIYEGPAAFLYAGLVGPPVGYAQLWSLSHPWVVARNSAMWMGLNSLNGLSYWGNAGTLLPNPGTSDPGVIAIASTSSPFAVPSTVPTTIGNMNWAIGAPPEPSAIALLAIGSLLALRRRTV